MKTLNTNEPIDHKLNNNPLNNNPEEQATDHSGTGFINVFKSTIAAACGIQTQENRERDFVKGKASTFVIAGIVFVIVFVVAMIAIVQLVLHLAQ